MESGLMHRGIAIESEGFAVQTLISTVPGVGSRPYQNAPGEPRVKNLIKRID